MKAEIEALIKDWRDAFLQANGRPAPKVFYENGWFSFFPSSGIRYRRAALEKFRDELRRRAAVPPQGHDGATK